MAERKVTFLLNANVKNFTKGMDSASKRFKKFGRNMERMGRNMTRSITAPVLAAGAGAAKMASDFEASMTKIETLVGLSRGQVQGMRKDVLALARGTGRAPQELSEALFTVTSAGLRGANAMQVLERASKASAIGLGETKEIARATTAVMQAYGEDVMSAAMATDTLTAIVREGNLEASELAPVLGRVVGIASQLDVSFQEVGASVATFTRLGVSSEEAVTGLRGVMNALLKPAAQGKKALDEVGLSFEGLRKQVQEEGLMATLRGLIEAFDGNIEGLSRVIPRVRALAAVMGTAGAQGESYEQILRNIQQATGIVDEGFEKVSKTTEFKFNKALASLKVSTIELGTVLLPVANKIIERVQVMAEWFGELSTESQTLAINILAISAAVGPTLLVLGKLAKLIGFIISPTFLATAAITALFSAVVVGGQFLVDNWKKIKLKLSNVLASITLNFQEMARDSLIALRNTADKLGFSGEKIQQKINNLDLTIAKGRISLGKNVRKYNNIEWSSIGDSAKNAFELLKNSIIKGLEGILNSSEIKALREKVNALFTIQPAESEGKSGSPIGVVPDISAQTDAYIKNTEKIRKANVDTTTPTIAALKGMGNAWDDFVAKAKDAATAADMISNALGNAIANMATSLAQSIGEMAAGSKNLKQVAIGLLNVLADLAMQIGSLFVSLGVAVAASLNPASLIGSLGISAIVAGGALIAAGAALKAILSGSQKTQAHGMAHGGVVPSGFPNDSYPAMLSSGETVIPAPNPLPSMSMNQKIEVPVYLNDREIARAMTDYNKDLGR